MICLMIDGCPACADMVRRAFQLSVRLAYFSEYVMVFTTRIFLM